MKFCAHCGTQLEDTAHFCHACGQPTAPKPAAQPAPPTSNENFFDKLTSSVNHLTGGQGHVRPPLKKLVSQIFVRHTHDEADEIFICGTSATTPDLSLADTAWPQPWLFTRVLLAFLAAFFMLHICCKNFDNLNAYPGLIVIGAFAVPIALFVFFLEMNTPKNISFFTTIKIFLVGGCASLLFTLLLYDVVQVGELDYLGAILVSIVEEFGKLAIVVAFIYREKATKYTTNGLLIGAAVGAGFAAFESAGYAFTRLLLTGSYDAMFENILLRAALTPGGHVIWAAMSGYAVVLVTKGKPFSLNFLGNSSFWKIFPIPLVLHAVWDMPIPLGQEICLIPILCLLAGWFVILIMIHNCLNQIGETLAQSQQAAQQPPQ